MTHIHLEWGTHGAVLPADVTIIVDSLSFSTAVSVACGQGARIFPFAWRQHGAAFADALGVPCAGKRAAGGYSLSPPSLMQLQPGEELVLPSPNGATLSMLARSGTVLAGCLRNAKALADYVNRQKAARVVLVAAGERWRADGSLRPAFEDLIGCGAIGRYLHGTLSPEAQAGVDAFNGVGDDVQTALLACQSGLELSDAGHRDDVIWASALNADDTVPRLRAGSQTYGSLELATEDKIDAELLDREIVFYQAD